MASNDLETPWQFNKNVCERNEHMFENGLLTDVVFRVSSLQGEVRTVRAHMYTLVSASPVFWAMFCWHTEEDDEVIVPDVEPEAFVQMLRYIYTDKIDLSGTYVMHVLHAAKKYQLPALVQLCINYLDNELDASNACSILDHSRLFNEITLVQKCLEKIEEKTEEALCSEDFMAVSSETLSLILDRDKLSMDEVKIFEKCYDWASNRVDMENSLRDVFGDNLYTIRFPVIPIQEFADIVCPKKVLTSKEQLEIFKYLTSPLNNAKPQAFICEARKPAWRFKIGDRVRPLKMITLRSMQGLNTTFHVNSILTVADVSKPQISLTTGCNRYNNLSVIHFVKIE